MRLGWTTVVPAMLAFSMAPAIAGDYDVRSMEKITDGIFPVWSPDGKEIAFTRQERDTFEIYFMKADGSDQRCMTCGKEELREAGFRGQPYYHPAGKYLVFVAESVKLRRKGNGVVERPGVGRNNNVWIMNREGTRFWRVTDYAENWGVIRPSFSYDGTMICWNEEFSMEKYANAKGRDAGGHDWGTGDFFARKGEELGAWRVKWAKIDFDRDGTPRLSGITTVDPPEGLTLLEASGFTPDDRRLIYSYTDLSESPGGRGIRSDIYLSDLKGGSLQRLTSTPTQHDENAMFSPDGRKIAWTHPVGTGRKGMPGIDVEIHLMNSDGSQQTRLTYFSDPKSEHYDKNSKQISEVHWSPDGKRLAFGHASRANLRDSNIGSSVWILTFEGADDVKDRPTGAVRPPEQPKDGPGGSSYRHGGVRTEVYGEGPEQFWIYEPRDPAPRSAPVIVFGHGGGAVNPRFYGAWIEHLVRRGNIVVYPRYQHNVLSRAGKLTGVFVESVKAAFQELKKSERVRPEMEKVALVGHSAGGVLSANLAAMMGSEGLPRPRALMIIEPGIGIPLEDLSKVPKDALALVLVGEGDTLAGDKDAKRIFGGLSHIDPADRDYIIVRTDDRGDPQLLADHLSPNAVSEAFDSQPGKRRRARVEAKLENSVNAIDFYGYWKLLDGLTDAAFYGRNRDYALGNTRNQRYMGTWSDGTPVKELVITDTP